MIKDSAIIILGASGDLTKRKLVPSLIKLFDLGELDVESCRIFGNGRTPYNDNAFRSHLGVTNSEYKNVFHYATGLSGLYDKVMARGPFSNVLLFLSLPPANFASTAKELYDQGFRDNAKIIVEKPFGYNLKSAKELNKDLLGVYKEEQIYRIDHYLGKEIIQNLSILRFGNSLISSFWDNQHIDSIQVNAFETIGVEKRGAYYDSAGALRDMVQNHLLQLISILLMEEPASLYSEDIRQRKIELLENIELMHCDHYQYHGYKKEEKIAADSKTETFAELEFQVHNNRWSGVPIYVRTGKMMPRNGVDVVVRLKPSKTELYPQWWGNNMILTLQPKQQIFITQQSKKPGIETNLAPVQLSLSFDDSFEDKPVEPYAKMLLEAFMGNRTMFVNARETEVAWEKIDKALDSTQISYYQPGQIPASKMGVEWFYMDHYL